MKTMYTPEKMVSRLYDEPFFYAQSSFEKKDEIAALELLLKGEKLEVFAKRNLETYINVLKMITPEEEDIYKKYIKIWECYDEKNYIKITTKDEVFAFGDRSGFYSMRPCILNSYRYGDNDECTSKRKVCLKLRLARSTYYNTYTGLDPKKDFHTTHKNDSGFLHTFIEIIPLGDIISFESVPKLNTNYKMLFN